MPSTTLFSPDSEITDAAKNDALSALLAGAWNDLAIVSIKRIEKENQKGWQVTYRKG